MKVILRELETGNGVKMKHEKMVVLFNWIKEFRFTSYENAGLLLGTGYQNTGRFIKSIERDEYVKPFKNTTIKNTRLVALTQKGMNFLKEHKLALDGDIAFQYQRYSKTLSVLHHLSLQTYLLKRINEFSEITWEYNLDNELTKKGAVRPDCIVIYKPNDFKVAIEYERWSKSKKRIYYKFYCHLENIQKGFYSGVLYIFEDEKDYKLYLSLFNQDYWPRYKLLADRNNTQKLQELKQKFNAKQVKGLSNVFDFRFENSEK